MAYIWNICKEKSIKNCIYISVKLEINERNNIYVKVLSI